MADLMPRARSKDISDEVYEADSYRRIRQQSLCLEMNRSNNPNERSCKMELRSAARPHFLRGRQHLSRQATAA